MIVKTIKGSFYNPRRDYASSCDYEEEDEMISGKQRHTLTNLIYEKIGDKDERERWLNQLEDMTSVDAEDAIFDFLSARWR